jgi:Zn finger protein HypA/HybF involved in hydrogenase expression
MGTFYDIECNDCEYFLPVTEGIGMAHKQDTVFYGPDDSTGNWSAGSPDSYYEDDKPMLLSLVESKEIQDAAFAAISRGAIPDYSYGHELYFCSKCNNLENLFYFKLLSSTEQYEPDYRCSKCKTALRRVVFKHDKDLQIETKYRNNRKVELKCPDCGSKKLTISGGYILWD